MCGSGGHLSGVGDGLGAQIRRVGRASLKSLGVPLLDVVKGAGQHLLPGEAAIQQLRF